jgi:hypothetical protein
VFGELVSVHTVSEQFPLDRIGNPVVCNDYNFVCFLSLPVLITPCDPCEYCAINFVIFATKHTVVVALLSSPHLLRDDGVTYV